MTDRPWDKIFKKDNYIWHDPDPIVTSFIGHFEAGARLLDAGCGCGRHLIYAAKHDLKTTGLDESVTALLYAKKWVKSENKHCELIQGDFFSFPFIKHSFDAIIASYCLNHGKKQQIFNAFSEFSRVLSSDGELLVILNAHGDYREGIGERLEEGTYMILEGPEAYIPHHYARIEFVKECLKFMASYTIKHQKDSIYDLENKFGIKMQLRDHPLVKDQKDPCAAHWIIHAKLNR